VEAQATPSVDRAPVRAVKQPGGTSSERVRLAILAHAVALRVPGVVGTDSWTAGLHVTLAGDQRLEGVRCVVASAGHSYEVSLRLICALVSLPALAAVVRSRVVNAATRAGLPVDAVSIQIAGLAGPDL
jgi:hypothetical protein